MILNVNDVANNLSSENSITYVIGDKPAKSRAINKVVGLLLTTAFAITTLPALADTGYHSKATNQTQVKKHVNKKKTLQQNKATYFANMRDELNKVKVDQSGVPIQIDEENSNRFTIAKQLFSASEKALSKEDKIRYNMMGIGIIVEDSHDLVKVNGNPTLGSGFDLVQQKKSFGSEIEMYKTIVKAGYSVDDVMNYATGKSKTIKTDFKKSLALFSLIQDDYIKIAKIWAGPQLWGLDDATTLVTVDVPGFKMSDYSDPEVSKKVGTKYSTTYNMTVEEMAGAAYASYNNGGRVLGKDFTKNYKRGDYLAAIESFTTGYKDKDGVYYKNQRLINAITFLTSGKQGKDYLTAGTFDTYNQTNNLAALKSAIPETYKIREMEKVFRTTHLAVDTYESQQANGKKLSTKQTERYEQQKQILDKIEKQLNSAKDKIGEERIIYDNKDIIQELNQKGLYENKKETLEPFLSSDKEIPENSNKMSLSDKLKKLINPQAIVVNEAVINTIKMK